MPGDPGGVLRSNIPIFLKSGLWLDVLCPEDHLPFQELLVKNLSNGFYVVNQNPEKQVSRKKPGILSPCCME
jgi:hypothetical protein